MASVLINAERLIVATAPGPSQVISPGYVLIEDGRIADVGERSPGRPDIELDGGVLAPGLVDLQVNGYYGHDLVDADEAGWHTIVRGLPETGVTSFVPTFITAPVPFLADALRRAKDLLPGLPAGSRVLGVHVEGPFLSERRRGAHNPEWLVDPTPEAIQTLLATGLVKIMTLAPERAGGLAAVQTLSRKGVLVSVGHSDASADQVAEAAAAGARMVTHLFNGQSGIDHRKPGVAAQALADRRLTAGLIADLAHVAPVVCKLVIDAAPGRIALVTDAAAAAGMPPGRYELGGQPIDLPADGPPLRLDGTIAGSALRLDTGIGNVVRLGVELTVAVDAATRIPANLIGRPDLGRIAPGAAADLVFLDTEDFTARATWVAGELLYERKP